MSPRRALVVCPGRGSYDRSGLGQLQDRPQAVQPILTACDAHRQAHDRPTVSTLDAAESFRAALHVAGENASLLTFACSMADLAELNRERFDVVGVTGNSMGWYTALAASGALPLPDAIRLVDTLGAYQLRNVIGGQVLYPVTNAEWRHDPALQDAVDAAIDQVRAAGHTAEMSIHLGGYAVIGADPPGVKLLQQLLPAIERGSRNFPVQLPMHSAFHTSLLAPTAARAQADLADLPLTAPDVPLIDGRGAVFRPHWADPARLFDYTLDHQIVRPYDFTTAVRTALRHTGAEVVIALGPGNSLGGPLARILVQEGWRGATDRDAFDALQQSDQPVLLSFGVTLQRKKLL